MGEGEAIKKNVGTDILQMARTKRHIHLLEKIQKSKSLTKKELEELADFESAHKKTQEKKKENSNIVSSIPKVASALACSSRTVRNWIGEGMPILPDKNYDIDAIRQWRTERDNRRKPTEAEELENAIRKERLRALEMENQSRTGRLISLEDVEKGRVARILAVKQELLAMPRAMAKVLEHLEARQIEALLKNKITQVIKKFSGQ